MKKVCYYKDITHIWLLKQFFYPAFGFKGTVITQIISEYHEMTFFFFFYFIKETYLIWFNVGINAGLLFMYSY